jgi:hypothetical protein
MSAVTDVRDCQKWAATNQSLFREVNERVNDVSDSFKVTTTFRDWVCECADDTCVERLNMSTRDYEAVRGEGTLFLVAPSEAHVWLDVERVVERHENYWIVEKLELAAKIANANDPRRDGPLGLTT